MKQLDSLFSFVNTSTFTSFEATIIDLFTSLPNLPKGFSDFLVKVAPFLAIIFGILNVISSITLLTSRSMYMQWFEAAGVVNPYAMYMRGFEALVTGLLLIAAFSHLKDKKMFGWRLLFWSTGVSVLISLLMMDIVGALIGAAISWYLLSQMRPSYS